jgi:hypothetical protein
LQSRLANDHHGHPYAVRGLVLAGAFTVSQNNNSKTYCAGEIFSVAAEQDHAEEVGPHGQKSLSGASTSACLVCILALTVSVLRRPNSPELGLSR